MSARLHFAAVILLLSLAFPAIATLDSRDVRLQEYGPPVIAVQSARPAFTHSRWVAADDDGFWLITPQHLLRLAKRPPRAEASTHAALGRTEAATGMSVVASVALPPRAQPQPDRVAAASGDHVWLIDSAAVRLWKVAGGKLAGPWLIGETIGAAVALPNGRLIVNTPGHGVSAFAIIGEGGFIEKRFGVLRASPVAALSTLANTYIPARLGDNRIVAAHEYEPLARVYSLDGMLISEVILRSATVSRLAEEQRKFAETLKIDKATCCVEATSIRFASDVLPRNDTFVIRFGASTILEEFDLEGMLVATHAPRRARAVPVRHAGAVFTTGGLLELTDRDLVFHPFAASSSAVSGRVLLGDGAPAAAATVSIRLLGGGLLTIHTDGQGKFRLTGPAPSTPARVSASAVGHLTQDREGTLAEIVDKPFRLEPLPKQCVTVVARDGGGPVTSFRIVLARSARTSTGVSFEEGATAQVDDMEGQGCLTATWLPPWTVRVEATGYADEVRTAEKGEPLDIVLAPEGVLRVAVRDQQGRPVGGAEIAIDPAAESERTYSTRPSDHLQQSDDNGVARFAGLREEILRLTIRHPAYARLTKTIDVRAGTNETEAVLEAGLRAGVEVVTNGSQPIDGATVTLDSLGNMISEAVACTTRGDGRCALAPLPAGRLQVRVAAAGYAKSVQQFEVAAGRQPPVVRVVLRRGVMLTARVVGVDRYPGLQLKALLFSANAPVQQIEIGADGLFKANDVPGGVLGISIEEGPKRAALLYERVELPDVPQHDITLLLPMPMIVRGRVTLEGRGCGTCSLSFSHIAAESSRAGATARVQPDGTYEARLSTRGRYLATAEHAETKTRIVEVIDVEHDFDRNFNLSGGTLTVRVLDGDGQPVAGVSVNAARDGITLAEATTAENGSAYLRSLAPGPYQITASSAEAATTKGVDISSGASKLDLVLPRQRAIRLRVMSATTNLPVPVLAARVISGARRLVYPRLVPGADGVFVVPLPDPTEATLVLQVPGYGIKTVPHATPSTSVQNLVMQARKSLQVDVSPRIQPCFFELRQLSGMPVALSFDSDPGPVPLTTRQVDFLSNEAGSYVARLRACDGTVMDQRVTLVAGGPIPLVRFEP